MRASVEHSPLPRRASNGGVRSAWTRLARACRLAGASTPDHRPGETLHRILGLAAEACGAERAFLALASDAAHDHDDDDDPIRILALSTARPDGSRVPSQSVLRRAFTHPRPLLLLDIGEASRAMAGSVRSLGLRSIVSVRVALKAPGRAVMVLDSRDGFPLDAADLRETLDAFSGLVSATWNPSWAPEPDGDDPPLSQAGRSMMAWVRRIAPTELPVLVQGESGVGKERVSRALHRLGPRHDGPFVAINCTAVTETLLEAELFGTVRGAYTGSERDRPGLFRQADGGTLFLDEVGDMPLAMQAKLLRVLDTGRIRPVGGEAETAVDVRVVAATHRNLRRRVASGRFRADLFHRLAVLEVRVPPLRSRLDELPALVGALAPRLRRETRGAEVRLAADAWPALRAHPWPGNVRELHAVLARAALCARGRAIRAADLDLHADPTSPATDSDPALERQMIETALRRTGGSIARAASLIGWSRQKLYRRMESLDVPRRPEAAE